MDINAVSTPAIGKSSPQADVKSAGGEQTLKQKGLSVDATVEQAQKATSTGLKQQVEQVNSRLDQLGLGVSFSIDESSQMSVIRVIDRSTDEVIKQFPNEEALKRIQHIQSYLDSVQQNGMKNKENLTGVLFSEII